MELPIARLNEAHPITGLPLGPKLTTLDLRAGRFGVGPGVATDVATVMLPRRLDALTGQALRREAAACLDAGQANLILDLSDVREIDCSGMAALVALARSARARGGDLVARGVTPQLRCLFEMTGLDHLIAE